MTDSELDGNQGKGKDVVTTQEEVQKVQEENNEIEMIDNIEVLKEEISSLEKSIRSIEAAGIVYLSPLAFFLPQFLKQTDMCWRKFAVVSISLIITAVMFFMTPYRLHITVKSNYDETHNYIKDRYKLLKGWYEEKIQRFSIISVCIGLIYLFMLSSIFLDFKFYSAICLTLVLCFVLITIFGCFGAILREKLKNDSQK